MWYWIVGGYVIYALLQTILFVSSTPKQKPLAIFVTMLLFGWIMMLLSGVLILKQFEIIDEFKLECAELKQSQIKRNG